MFILFSIFCWFLLCRFNFVYSLTDVIFMYWKTTVLALSFLTYSRRILITMSDNDIITNMVMLCQIGKIIRSVFNHFMFSKNLATSHEDIVWLTYLKSKAPKASFSTLCPVNNVFLTYTHTSFLCPIANDISRRLYQCFFHSFFWQW